MLRAHGEDAKAIAGGTALIILAKARLLQPRYLVALKLIPGQDAIEPCDGGVRVGALVTQRALETSPLLRERYPLLAEAASRVGNLRVRVMSTLGGSLGEADMQCDPPAALFLYDALVETSAGREVPIREFFRGPYETCLAWEELVQGVRLPAPPPAGTRHVYLKYTTGPVTDRPCVGVAGLGRLDGAGRWAELRVACNGVGPVPLDVDCSAAIGERPGEALAAEIGRVAAAASDPMDDLRGSAAYKREVTGVFVRRAVQALAEAPKGVA
jgi:carbon-monoxide dehydrogenase medium subunit